ncbi:hypothetical protein RFI_34779 [Reticulomyxa filosa]|uniref:Endonuclease/exonuclease/phosphatase domain-containing protein n=1 Tax=Reticulomyxa filosa TaxID=46433 RepID=X6LLY5_RETFI|nr:hypothetical protein RFI_34779 [Reticulomyxa filosa]|eukprot:ETO02639.1 hypothetical protein RFI_34779 [Reticulomyxa filosa]
MNARTKYTGDKVNNQNGNRLMERCQRNALLILNIENCKGQRTFHANKTEAKIFSIVDYAIVNIHEFWEESRIKMEVLKQHVASDHYPIMCTFEQGKTGNTRSMRLHAPYHCRVSNETKRIQRAAKAFVEIMETKRKENMDGITVKERYNIIMEELYKTLIDRKVITFRKNPTELAGNRRPETEELHNILEEINKKIQMNEHGSERVNDLIEKYQNEQQKQSQKEIERLLNKIQEQHKKRNDFEVYKRIRLEDKGEWFPVYDEGEIVVQQSEKIKVISKYYEKLYSEDEDIEEELHSKIKERYAEVMVTTGEDKSNYKITTEEGMIAAQKLKSYKATFLDCISNEVGEISNTNTGG